MNILSRIDNNLVFSSAVREKRRDDDLVQSAVALLYNTVFI